MISVREENPMKMKQYSWGFIKVLLAVIYSMLKGLLNVEQSRLLDIVPLSI